METNKIIEAMQKLMQNNIDRMKEDLSILLSVVTSNKEESVEEKVPAAGPEPVSSDISLPFFNDSTKNVIVQNETKAEPEPEESKVLEPNNIDITKYVSKIYPIINDKDFVKNMAVCFNNKRPGMSISEFFINCNLKNIIQYRKFYSFQALSDIYNAYTDSDSTAKEMILAIAKPEYLYGVDVYQLDGEFAFGFKGIQVIQDNILNCSMDALYSSGKKAPEPLSSFTDTEAKADVEESKGGDLNDIQEVKCNTGKVSIASFIVNELDIDNVIEEDMTFRAVAELYNQKYNKKVLPRSVRNVFALNGVQPIAIFKEKKFRVHGQDLAILIEELRKKINNESILTETTSKNVTQTKKKIVPEYTENDTNGMKYSLAEKFAGLFS